MTRTRSEFLQTGLRVARFFGNELVDVLSVVGGIGASLWNNWRDKTDAEFEQSFWIAVNEFSSKTLEFTQKTEQEVELVISVFLKDLCDFNQATIAALEGFIEKADLSKIYHKLHDSDPDEKVDDDDKEILGVVLSNLRDQKISARSEANIREMMGIR